MADIGALYVRILSDVKAFGADLKSKMSGAAGDAEKGGKKVGGSFTKGLVAASAAIGGLAIAKYLGDAGKAASELQADMGKTEEIFGGAGKSMVDWSSHSAQALGLSQDQALTLANRLGSMYAGMGMSGKGAADLSKRVIQLGTDMGTFAKKDPAVAINAIRMASLGATRGLKQFGISIDKDAITAQALSMHLGTTTVNQGKLRTATLAASAADSRRVITQNAVKTALINYNTAVQQHGKNSAQAQKASIALANAQERDKASADKAHAAHARVSAVLKSGKTTLTQSEKAQATLALITERSTKAQGAFAKEGNTLEVQQRKTRAEFANMKAQLGTALLPIFTKVGSIIATQVAPALASMAGWLAKNSGWLTPLVGVLTGFALAVMAVNKAVKAGKAIQEAYNAVTKLFEKDSKLAAAAQWLWNAAMSANPIVLIVIAIAALIAILVVLYLKVGFVRDAINAAFAAIVVAAKWVWNIIVVAFHAIVNAIAWAIAWVRSHWPMLIAIIAGPIGVIVYLIVRNFTTIRNFVVAAWNGILNVIRSVAGAIVRFVSGFVSRIVGFFSELPGALIRFGSAMIHGFLNGITSAWSAVTGWLSGVGTRILRGYAHMGDLLFNVGHDIIMGLVHGLEAAWHFVTDKISSLTSHLPGIAKKVLGIGSPSKVMAAEVGQWISRGIAVGITQHGGAVQSAISGLPHSVYMAGAAGAGGTVGRAATVENMYVQALDARHLAGAVADRLAYEELRQARV